MLIENKNKKPIMRQNEVLLSKLSLMLYYVNLNM